ncbi:hypothetical protein ACJMK2_030474 [Sinanodonta woodiana]|uniref:Uncharacterized protein n=1 Tax=Sinanodonta woodiana TaxID=1069815 RepID=A0ABD3WVW3_SINWO
MADFPKSSTMNASVLRKIRKPLIEKKRKIKINQSHDQLKIALLDNVKNNKPHVSSVDKAENSKTTTKDLHLSPKQNTTSTEEHDYIIADVFLYGDEECMHTINNDLNFENGITHEPKYSMQSHFSCICAINNAESTAKYSQGTLAIRSTLGVQVKSSSFTPLHVDIPSSTQFPSYIAMTPDLNGELLMPIPGYSAIKTEDPYSPFYYPTQKNDSSVRATSTDDALLNVSSRNSSLKKQSSVRHNSTARRRLSFSSSARDASVKSDIVWRPW